MQFVFSLTHYKVSSMETGALCFLLVPMPRTASGAWYTLSKHVEGGKGNGGRRMKMRKGKKRGKWKVGGWD